MAYDHIADISDTYPIEQVIDVLELHSAREAWCRIGESENYLNYIARKAIIGTIADAFSQGEVHLADLGVQIYQVATNTRLAGMCASGISHSIPQRSSSRQHRLALKKVTSGRLAGHTVG